MPATATPETAAGNRHRYVLPSRLGAYRVLGKLGRGGMNHVLRGLHITLGREVALKILAPHQRDEPATYRRFKAEARAAAAACHPNLLTIHDAARDQGWCYLAMELAPGGDLRSRLRRGRMEEATVLRLLRDLAWGLEAFHSAGFLHRDVKPANILLAANDTPKLADMGVAIGLHEQDGAEVVGSPAYMAPEQIRGVTLDARADVHALAATGYELLTGQVPWRRRREDCTPDRFRSEPAPSCRALRPELSEGTDALLRSALAEDPSARPASAAAFALSCDRLLAPAADSSAFAMLTRIVY